MLTGVADTTVLNNFAQVQRPDLLRQSYSSLATPPQVLDELEAGVRLGYVPSVDWSWLRVVQLTPALEVRLKELGSTIGRGEAACLAVAEGGGWFVLTDDGDARRLARSLGIPATGTLGTLDRLVQKGIVTLEEGDHLLGQMISRGYRSPVRSLQELNPA
jgi:predicted nucleic acid-binding protein